jgi:hypothetical protein
VELAELAVNEQDTIRSDGNSDVAAHALEQIDALGDSDGLDLSLVEILGTGPTSPSKTG